MRLIDVTLRNLRRRVGRKLLLVAGLSIGAAPPIDAVYSAEVFDDEGLGTLMGVQQLLTGMMMAIGPLVAGLAFDATGSHAVTITLAAIGYGLAALAIRRAVAVQRGAHGA